jgi:hypothetical protein
MGERATKKEYEKKPSIDDFTLSKVRAQFLFPSDIDTSTFGHTLSIVWDPDYPTESFGGYFFFFSL